MTLGEYRDDRTTCVSPVLAGAARRIGACPGLGARRRPDAPRQLFDRQPGRLAVRGAGDGPRRRRQGHVRPRLGDRLPRCEPARRLYPRAACQRSRRGAAAGSGARSEHRLRCRRSLHDQGQQRRMGEPHRNGRRHRLHRRRLCRLWRRTDARAPIDPPAQGRTGRHQGRNHIGWRRRRRLRAHARRHDRPRPCTRRRLSPQSQRRLCRSGRIFRSAVAPHRERRLHRRH